LAKLSTARAIIANTMNFLVSALPYGSIVNYERDWWVKCWPRMVSKSTRVRFVEANPSIVRMVAPSVLPVGKRRGRSAFVRAPWSDEGHDR
jgi:hypothetical protein